jgi:phosphohistidine phosphatase SixA
LILSKRSALRFRRLGSTAPSAYHWTLKAAAQVSTAMIYVLLMRHGAHERIDDEAGPPTRALTAEGRRQAQEVASKLEEFIDETKNVPDDKFTLKEIWHATSSEATETARTLRDGLTAAPTPVGEPKLGPKSTSPYGPVGGHREMVDKVRDRICSLQSGNALLIVGHQPMLGWISEALTGDAHPIERCEMLCLRFARQPHPRRWWQPSRLATDTRAVLRWVLTPSERSASENGSAPAGNEAMAGLTEKIRGKMEGAKLLGTFSTAILGFMLSTLIDKTKLDNVAYHYQLVLLAAALALFLSILLYFASYYAYDSLLMPIRFWGERARTRWSRQPRWLVMRPPSSATWVLYQNMMHIWTCLFTPAVVLVCTGLVLLGFAVAQPKGPWLIFWIVLSVLLAISLRPIYRVLGPRLGSQD